MYLISASLVGVIAQRLVKKVCPYCNGENNSCEYCHGSGYLGRTVVYEILQIDDEIRQCISDINKHKEIKDMAIKSGKMITFDDSYRRYCINDLSRKHIKM